MKTIIERQLTPEFVRALNEAEHEPLIIEVHGKRFVVLREEEHSDRSETSPEDSSQTSLTEFFRNSPLYGVELDLERDKTPSREV
ncbi:hypothetical protein QUF72_17860 [Desulfobacterales bacterium HSG2]|nr:hypothetical protein [Desulfobacterales bacterium HSG2]